MNFLNLAKFSFFNLVNILLLDLYNLLFDLNLKSSILLLSTIIVLLLISNLLAIICGLLAKVLNIKVSNVAILLKL